mmetsp:Transcript_36171/g.59903  ORF Transcript_36171/g.59903 Transcript_36171/m.59903 type:complete len:300 (-) Transcript_36171:339-1238(-)|eukprot:CAMPEP_0119322144 /NCGR_PEP_ID=MMETSP1333-20130426/57400_1 /TAXON_ID=418940 /ORGANISM="Scyphosphaera apsteinii, Strain RCC1455" /LENGTH=299 /DNA_ID=CAMNT_0007329293 /DNA_START=13 /DNA_END=912 /DNA_ORIENTATION=-
MQWEILGKSGAAAIRVRLPAGRSVKAEPDALVTMSQHIQVGARMDAGLLSGLLRTFLSGESLFCQTVTASCDGDAVFCASEVGDAELIVLREEEPLLLQKGAFVASDETVNITTATQAGIRRAAFSGAGLFVLQASGRGTLAVSAHGSILKYTLGRGEVRAVDNGHLVAWSAEMPYEMRMASRKNSILGTVASSAASGEGLMCFFEGPGRLWLQTHKPEQAGASQGRPQRNTAGNNVVVLCICGFFVMLVVVGVLVAVAISFASISSSGGGRSDVRAPYSAYAGRPRYTDTRNGAYQDL